MLPEPVRLYDQPRAPNPMRLNLFLAEKGVEIERVTVDLMAGEHKSEAYLAKVGESRVPALELSDGTVLTETQAICRYVEALHREPNLMGRDAREMAEIEMWQRRAEFGLFAAVGHCFRHTNKRMAVLEDQCPEWGELNRGRIDAHLRALDCHLIGRSWLASDRFTNADITAYIAASFRRILRHPIPDGLDALGAWLERVRARPSIAVLET
ncbi:MAG: glutathione S-transferase family protein [Pseudomonadota bacterium]